VFDDQLAGRRTAPTAAPQPTVARRREATTPTNAVLGLQQQAGNRATGRWLDDVALQRQEDNDAVRADSEAPASGVSTATVDGIGVFDLLAFNARGQHQGTGGAPSVADIQVVLRGDALPQLMQAAAQGRPIKRVVLRTAKMTVTVTDCVVASFNSSGDDGATASVTFNGAITFEVAPAAP
jgi:hypothetical protein